MCRLPVGAGASRQEVAGIEGKTDVATDGAALLRAAAILLRAALVSGDVPPSSAVGRTVMDCIVEVDALVGEPTDKGPESYQAFQGVLDIVMERLLSLDAYGHVEERQVATLAVVGSRLMAALGQGLELDLAEVPCLEDLRSESASDAAFRLLRRSGAWLLHPLVVIQMDRWRRAHTRLRRASYLPRRHQTSAVETQQDSLRWESALSLLAQPGIKARGNKVEPEAFQRIHREIQIEVARVRAAFEAWVGAGDVPPERVRAEAAAEVIKARLKQPTWLSDEALTAVCDEHFRERACIDRELHRQYVGCRQSLTERTVRSWVTAYIPSGWRPIPRRWRDDLRKHPLAHWLKP